MNIKKNSPNERVVQGLEEKERFIVETILVCNNFLQEIKKNKKIGNHQLFENFDQSSKSTANLVQLFEAVAGVRWSGAPAMKVPEPIHFRKNNYAYLLGINSLLENYKRIEAESMVQLNEAMHTLGDDRDITYDLVYFQKELQDCIHELQKIDDFSSMGSIDPAIQRMKILAKKPIYVYGFDVVNNPIIRDDIKQKFDLDIFTQAFAILFDKTNKQLLYPFPKRILCYDIQTNIIGDFNEVNAEKVIDEFTGEKLQIVSVNQIDLKNYRAMIAEQNNNNCVALWTNIPVLDLKYTDNLYGDAFLTEMMKKQPKTVKSGNLFVKPLNDQFQ